jgi:hypothetical protein
MKDIFFPNSFQEAEDSSRVERYTVWIANLSSSVLIYQSTRSNIQEDLNLHRQRHKNTIAPHSRSFIYVILRTKARDVHSINNIYIHPQPQQNMEPKPAAQVALDLLSPCSKIKFFKVTALMLIVSCPLN